MPLTQEYKWRGVNCQGNVMKFWEMRYGGGGGWGREPIIGYSISSWGISCPLLSGRLDPTLTKTYFAINL